MAEALFILCLLGAALPLVLYPLAVILVSRLFPRSSVTLCAPNPSVSVITVMHGASAFVAPCVDHFRSLEYQAERELILFEDGESEAFALAAQAAVPDNDAGITIRSSGVHQGKARTLNAAVSLAVGEILIFTDADSMLLPDAVSRIVRPFADPSVGGVCGKRMISGDHGSLRQAQATYFDFDQAIKDAESHLGNLTSNDGKLYAVRRSAFRGIPDGVTDDLFACLDVVRQGLRFVYEPTARVRVRTPSRDAAHELERRRRIVSTSLRGLWLCRELFDPRRFGWYSCALFINKVLRRGLPFFVGGCCAAGAALAPGGAVLVASVLGVLTAMAFAQPNAVGARWGKLVKIGSVAWYFSVGIFGTALGVLDFARGRVVVAWTPRKGDGEGS